MDSYSLTGADTLVIAGRVLADFADADNAVLSFPNPKAVVKAGKDGNAIFAENATGRQAELVIRVLRGSPDDKFLDALSKEQDFDFSSFELLTGQFVKRVGDGLGNVSADSYLLRGGIFTKNVEAKSNVEGDTEQSISIYTIGCAAANRRIF